MALATSAGEEQARLGWAPTSQEIEAVRLRLTSAKRPREADMILHENQARLVKL